MLKIDNLTFSYGVVTVFDNASFQVNQNELTVIMGTSGSGKSTLMDIIYLKYPVYFDYYYNGNKVLQNDNQLKNNIYYLNQDLVFPEDLTVKQQWDLLQKIYSQDILLDKYVEELKLKEILNLYPKQLSGGERLRVALINALICQPDILLLDEPTASLNNELSMKLIDILQEYKKNHHVIVATHDDNFIEVSDVLYRIDNKKLLVNTNNSSSSSKLSDSKTIEKKKLLWFSQFIRMKRHHIFKNILRYIWMAVIISFCAFSFCMNENFIKDYSKTIAEFETNNFLVYKAVDYKYPGYEMDNINFPITSKELTLIKEVNHINKLTPKIVLSLYEFNHDDPFEKIEPMLKINQNGKTIYDVKNDENYYGFKFESLDFNNESYSKQIEYIGSNKNEGIMINRHTIEEMGLTDKALENAVITLEIGAPVCDVSGYRSMCYGMECSSDFEIPANDLVTTKIQITLPIVGIIDGVLYDSVAPSGGTFYLSDDYLLSLVQKTKGTDEKVVYYKDDKLVDNVHEANYSRIYTPWMPNAYIVEVDSVENVKSVVDQLKSYGFSIDWKYLEYDAFGKSVAQTKRFLEIVSVVVVGFTVLITVIINYLKNRNEHDFNRWLKQIGFHQRKEILIIKGQKYLIDVSITIMLAIGFLMIICDAMYRKDGYLYPITPTMILIILVVTLLSQFIVPLIWEGFDYD